MAPELALTKLGKQQVQRLTELRDSPIEAIIPDDTTAKEVVEWGRTLASLYDRNDGERAIILHSMGRIHFMARMNPAVLEEAECATMTEYEDKILKCRDHRSTIWKISSGYKAFPGLTPKDIADIGTTNLERASKIADGKSPKQKKEIIAKAKELPTEEFKVWVEEESGHSAKGATTGATFPLIGSLEEITNLKEDLAEQMFIVWVGSNRPMDMIAQAINESKSEWGGGTASTPVVDVVPVQSGQPVIEPDIPAEREEGW